MKHKFNYKTELGGWVCSCQRYFDNKEQLIRHIKEEKVKVNWDIWAEKNLGLKGSYEKKSKVK